jgi:hypothetical protein
MLSELKREIKCSRIQFKKEEWDYIQELVASTVRFETLQHLDALTHISSTKERLNGQKKRLAIGNKILRKLAQKLA